MMADLSDWLAKLNDVSEQANEHLGNIKNYLEALHGRMSEIRAMSAIQLTQLCHQISFSMILSKMHSKKKGVRFVPPSRITLPFSAFQIHARCFPSCLHLPASLAFQSVCRLIQTQSARFWLVHHSADRGFFGSEIEGA